MSAYQSLQKKLGYQFSDIALLQLALTHRSVHKTKNNERLEFLGDSVLSVIVSTALFQRNPKLREGELSQLRAALVRGETIADMAEALGVSSCLQLGIGEDKAGGRKRASILAGAFEAILGAIYLDSNFGIAQACVLRWYGDRLSCVSAMESVKDAKSQLQEWLQARRYPLPEYSVTITGADHAQTFDVVCHVDGFSIETTGQSTSRRRAEQIAAKHFLEQVNE